MNHILSNFESLSDNDRDPFYFSILNVDIDNLSKINYSILDLHKYLYSDMSITNNLNYFFIFFPKETFKINRNSKSDKLIENKVYNLIPNGTFENKSDYVIVPSHGFAILSHTSTKNYYKLISKFIKDLKDFFNSKGINVQQKNFDLFVNNKKFFGGNIKNYTYKDIDMKTVSSMMLITEFEPEKDFFYNDMHYSGNNEYTGLFEESKNISLEEIITFIHSDLIKLINSSN